jgi:acetyltransferase-like isoleucine patch superfamily enzyme
MFNDEKTSFLKKMYFLIRTEFNYKYFFKNKFSSIKGKPMVWGIWNVIIYGPNISLGKNVVIVGGTGYKTTITTVKKDKKAGRVKIGDNVLVMNGVRISSATEVIIGNDCMLANFCYLTDSDWHDIYDRTSSPGRSGPIILEDGVWIGDSAIICKGVHIGKNSIIGAGSVVRKDIPANVVAIGNPVKIVKKLDPERIVTMKKVYEDMK